MGLLVGLHFYCSQTQCLGRIQSPSREEPQEQKWCISAVVCVFRCIKLKKGTAVVRAGCAGRRSEWSPGFLALCTTLFSPCWDPG